MTPDEKIDLVLQKLSEKKPRDAWDKAQIVATVLTGVFTLILGYINLTITSKISEQQQAFSQLVHSDEEVSKQREDKRQEMDEFIQELGLLPDLTKLLENKNNPAVQNIARAVLLKLDSNEDFKGHIIGVLVHFPKDAPAPAKYAVLYKTNTSTSNNKPFWVYLGQKQNEKWVTRFFDIENPPSVGAMIKSTSNVYKRKSKPVKIGEPDQWNLGEKIGVIKPNSTVTIMDTLTLEDNNYWALVK